ncbi:MAG: PilZ domain-containing protein [Phycisphaerae bacterium]|nr:PilZ domain-containing protein [Phycisphaerae bacterium]
MNDYYQDRRSDRRYSFTNSPVIWRQQGGHQWLRGYINDLSVSGLSLLVSESVSLDDDCILELQVSDKRKVLLELVRKEFVGRENLLGMRIISGDNDPAELLFDPETFDGCGCPDELVPKTKIIEKVEHRKKTRIFGNI